MKNIILFVSLLILLLVIGGFLIKFRIESDRSRGVACTLDAMQCPDGSYVGRIPPDCEFALCP